MPLVSYQLKKAVMVIDKDPTSYSLLTYLWVFGMAALGGIAGYIRKIKSGMLSRFSIVELIGEIVISAFVGIITFYLCEYAEIPSVLTAAFIGVSSHMGSRAIFMMETAADRAFSLYIDSKRVDKK